MDSLSKKKKTVLIMNAACKLSKILAINATEDLKGNLASKSHKVLLLLLFLCVFMHIT